MNNALVLSFYFILKVHLDFRGASTCLLNGTSLLECDCNSGFADTRL